MFIELTLLSYLIDRIFGEFSFIRHPVVIMGDYIKWFEKKFYKDDVFRGFLLTSTLIILVWLLVGLISSNINNIIILSIIASTTIASKMLYDSVYDIIGNPSHIKYLVSRDTSQLSSSDINKAGVETYAENFSDGVVAPLFYMLLFGLEGAFIYKAINTLDSMVGYRNERYEKFGKFSAKVDDVTNYIPARLTALIIGVLMFSKKSLLHFYSYGKKHDSPNAGHPISAMALAIGIKLGGDTVYFGKLKKKAFFGDGREDITSNDIRLALKLRNRFDLFILLLGVLYATTTWW